LAGVEVGVADEVVLLTDLVVVCVDVEVVVYVDVVVLVRVDVVGLDEVV
jgi:hypothetical protein